MLPFDHFLVGGYFSSSITLSPLLSQYLYLILTVSNYFLVSQFLPRLVRFSLPIFLIPIEYPYTSQYEFLTLLYILSDFITVGRKKI